MKRRYLYLSLLLLAILASYLYPTPDAPPGELYARVEPGPPLKEKVSGRWLASSTSFSV